MGSTVSDTVGNIYKEYLTPRMYKWYVDDTCYIIHKETAKNLLKLLNGIQPNIQITVELKRNRAFPLLDTLLRRNEDSRMDVSVEKTNTHRQVPQLPLPWLLAGQERVGQTPTWQSASQAQKKNAKGAQHVAEALKVNRYPRKFINSSSCSSPLPPQNAEKDQEAKSKGADRAPMVMLPYIAGVNEDIRRVCQRFKMKVIFSTVSISTL